MCFTRYFSSLLSCMTRSWGFWELTRRFIVCLDWHDESCSAHWASLADSWRTLASLIPRSPGFSLCAYSTEVIPVASLSSARRPRCSIQNLINSSVASVLYRASIAGVCLPTVRCSHIFCFPCSCSIWCKTWIRSSLAFLQAQWHTLRPSIVLLSRSAPPSMIACMVGKLAFCITANISMGALSSFTVAGRPTSSNS